ncbi:MAG: DUF2214 domain-containing protein [Paracoccaceae bacterium]
MLDALAGLENSLIAQALRSSRWSYAGANAAHILSIALLVGSVLPLDLRLIGAWPRIDRHALARVLVPTAGLGLALALATGASLFTVRAGDYVGLTLLYVKLSIVAFGAALAILLHVRAGWWLDGATPGQARAHGALSIACWLGALVCGRFIAYVQ